MICGEAAQGDMVTKEDYFYFRDRKGTQDSHQDRLMMGQR